MVFAEFQQESFPFLNESKHLWFCELLLRSLICLNSAVHVSDKRMGFGRIKSNDQSDGGGSSIPVCPGSRGAVPSSWGQWQS